MKRNTFLLPVLWFVVTTILLSLPGSALPKEDWLDKIWFDKWAHVAIFFILVLAWSRFVSVKSKWDNRKKTLFFTIAILTLLYGVGMEFVQKHFIRNRSFDYGDTIANLVGCCLGLIYSLKRYIKNKPL